MPGKRDRRHFPQLSKIERDLIYGMKTTGWLTCRFDGQVDRSECAVRNCWEKWTRGGSHARKTVSGATRPHSDSFNGTSRRAIAYDSRSTLIVMRELLTGQRYVDDILRPNVRPFLNGFPGAKFSSKIMLVRIQQELLKTSYVIFSLFHGRPPP
ncbi:transposable element Tc1 transposase [Trichonephila clavipes]|nr:transposable element Tc1 transposase [Trichonephila clavipes]